MRHVLALATLAILPLSVIIAQTAATPPATKKTTTTTKRKSTTTAKKGTTTTKRTTTTAKKGSTTVPRPTYRARQAQPTPERYKEIQQALAGKGYLKSEPTGTWNQESADAMRRFQQDQNINASGKIDSLSLIALGLGPKRAANPAPPPHPAEPKAESQPPAGN